MLRAEVLRELWEVCTVVRAHRELFSPAPHVGLLKGRTGFEMQGAEARRGWPGEEAGAEVMELDGEFLQ